MKRRDGYQTVLDRREEIMRHSVGIDYSAYEPMALAEMEKIATALQEEEGSHPLVLVHRVGLSDLPPHDGASFECR